jgi:MFS family permease
VALFFMAAFGGMLLSRVLWAQDVWHWSALSTGLAIAPGPMMVPIFSFLVAGRLIARFGPGRVIAAGCAIFAAGIVWWGLAMGLTPDYAGEMLGGMLLTGIGVGLTLPTFTATGAAALPPHSFATGSAVINMLRQIGLAIGVAILIAILGSAHSPHAILAVYRTSSWVIAALALAAGWSGLALLTGRVPRGQAASNAVPPLPAKAALDPPRRP